jgi:uncharacterized protein (TIGR03086 family)
MRQDSGVVAGIGRSVHMTGRVVSGIASHQWSAATPCVAWTVHDVLNHVVGGMRIFAAELTGRTPEADHEADWLGEDPAAAYADAAERDLTAWARRDALEGVVRISLGQLPARFAAVIHLVEVLVHGLDLACATGRLDVIDEELCEDTLRLLVDMGGVDPYRVPGVFGAELATDPGAPAHHRLVAYLGRDLARWESQVRRADSAARMVR